MSTPPRPSQQSSRSTSDVPVRRIDRWLAFGALIIAVLAVVCFFVIIFATAFGMNQADFAHGVWPVVAAIPLWGLPLAMAMMISLLIMSFVRRSRAAKQR